MPLYEYHCSDCGAEFEEVVSYAGADKVACSECDSKNTERVASTFSSTSKTTCSVNPGSACDVRGGG